MVEISNLILSYGYFIFGRSVIIKALFRVQFILILGDTKMSSSRIQDNNERVIDQKSFTLTCS
jgi:hypothetical protein